MVDSSLGVGMVVGITVGVQEYDLSDRQERMNASKAVSRMIRGEENALVISSHQSEVRLWKEGEIFRAMASGERKHLHYNFEGPLRRLTYFGRSSEGNIEEYKGDFDFLGPWESIEQGAERIIRTKMEGKKETLSEANSESEFADMLSKLLAKQYDTAEDFREAIDLPQDDGINMEEPDV